MGIKLTFNFKYLTNNQTHFMDGKFLRDDLSFEDKKNTEIENDKTRIQKMKIILDQAWPSVFFEMLWVM